MRIVKYLSIKCFLLIEVLRQKLLEAILLNVHFLVNETSLVLLTTTLSYITEKGPSFKDFTWSRYLVRLYEVLCMKMYEDI